MTDTHFTILIADTAIEIISVYDCVHEFCLDYLTEKKADFTIKTTEADISFEREREDKGGGRVPTDYPDSYLEVLACYRKIAEEMIERDIILMHGSAVAADGRGVMFVAESGTGKSTHAGIWKELFKERVQIINDDKPLIKVAGNGIFVCGTPWSGKKGVNTPINVPLRMIYKLERADGNSKSNEKMPLIAKGRNAVFELDNEDKWKAAASQSYKSGDPLKLAHSMSLLDEIIKEVPIRRLVCDMSEEAALTAYEGAGFGDIS